MYSFNFNHMKMKKFYLLACAGLLFAACSSEDGPANPEEQNAEAKYMAVNIVTNNAGTRADGDFEYGTEDEYAVSAGNVVFYFFNADGSPFLLTDGTNHKTPTTEAFTAGSVSTTSGNNITVSHQVLAFQSQSGSIPAQMITIINPEDNLIKDQYTLSQLREALITNGKPTAGFTMTNSVYADALGNTVDATPITSANIGTTKETAQANPVEIYVERVVAKLTTNATGDAYANNVVGKTYQLASPGQYADYTAVPALQVQITGWYMVNNTSNSFLLKNIDNNKAWTAQNWNDITNHRSYWANTPFTSIQKEGNTTISYNTMNNTAQYKYPFENTTDTTTIIFAAQLQTAKEDGTAGTAVTLIRWLSQYYTVDMFNTALENYLSNEIYTYTAAQDSTEGTWASIKAADIDFKAIENSDITVAGLQDYNVKLVLKDGNTTQYYSKKSTTATLTHDEVNAILANVPKVQYWNNGMCYYYANITHSASVKPNDVDANKFFGVVRNHWYQLTINSITGLGTPVYDATNSVIPKRPQDETWFLATTLNVLSWKIVSQTVDLTSK